MKKLVTVVLMMAAFLAQAQEKKEVVKRFKSQVYFDTDKYIIKPAQQKKLTAIADTLLKYDDYQIRLYGHTDSIGSLEYNKKLSRNRMLAVQRYLYDKGVDSSQVKFGYFGETRPQVPNSNEQNKARNRRVEIVATILKPVKTVVKKEEVEEERIEEIGCEEKDTVIIVEGGMELVIPACAFDTIPRSAICVDFTSLSTPEAIDSSELDTEDQHGSNLISFGMYNLCVRDCRTGQPIRYASQELTVRVPYNLPPECFNTVGINMYARRPGGAFRMLRDMPKLVKDSIGQYYIQYSFDRINCPATYNFDYEITGPCCYRMPVVSFKARELKITELHVIYNYGENINSRFNYRILQGGRKAKGITMCNDPLKECANRKATLWAKAVDAEGNEYEIKGKDLEHVKARKHFKRCQNNRIALKIWKCRIGFCILWKGTETRKYILKASDFTPVKEEDEPAKTAEN